MSFAFATTTSALNFAAAPVLASSTFVTDFMAGITAEQPHELEYLQAVREVAESVEPVIAQTPAYTRWNVLEKIARPDRVFQFNVTWLDDKQGVHHNTGWRVQQDNALGPYKGGLRFHPSVTLGTLKFLAFEQVFKNSLTGLPMGGGKGGSNFDPKGKSDTEVRSFCQAFMTQLAPYIGARVDVPAGDIGVGGREIGFLYGAYKLLRRENAGILTGKGQSWGGSKLRPEATGYGSVYFGAEMLATQNKEIKGMKAAISGSGNVAQYTAEKVLELEGQVLTMSDSGGTIVDNDGIDKKKLAWIMDLKNQRRGRIAEYEAEFPGPSVEYHAAKRPWTLGQFDIAFPSATQNELDLTDAQALMAGGWIMASAGANMPCTPDAIQAFIDGGVLYGLGKAANAGGVGVSGLEMSQNFMADSWSRHQVDERLKRIMKEIHRQSLEMALQYGKPGNYVVGANIAGFVKVANAIVDHGAI